jgi:hypothetical protein
MLSERFDSRQAFNTKINHEAALLHSSGTIVSLPVPVPVPVPVPSSSSSSSSSSSASATVSDAIASDTNPNAQPCLSIQYRDAFDALNLFSPAWLANPPPSSTASLRHFRNGLFSDFTTVDFPFSPFHGPSAAAYQQDRFCGEVTSEYIGGVGDEFISNFMENIMGFTHDEAAVLCQPGSHRTQPYIAMILCKFPIVYMQSFFVDQFIFSPPISILRFSVGFVLEMARQHKGL